jgi:tRNA pseudouridine55 synthase
MIIPEEGCLLLIDKPKHWTSFDVVKKIRNTLKVKKIGHAGTLDPLATGLLLIGVGKYTKKLHDLQGLDKSYSGTIEIGKTTPSYDLETEFDSVKPYDHLTQTEIEANQQKFLGWIDQVPPAHSAVKIGGERAYSKARKNEEVVLKSRRVNIKRFDFTRIDLPDIDFLVDCTKGTYIRSLAHDFGQALGTGAYLKELRRTSVGEFRVEDAHALDLWLKEISNEDH